MRGTVCRYAHDLRALAAGTPLAGGEVDLAAALQQQQLACARMRSRPLLSASPCCMPYKDQWVISSGSIRVHMPCPNFYFLPFGVGCMPGPGFYQLAALSCASMAACMRLMPKHLARAAVAAAWQARVNYQLALLASQQAGGQPLATGGLRGSRSLDPGLCAPPASQMV